MRKVVSTFTVLGGIAVTMSASTALAGPCGMVNGHMVCQPSMVVVPPAKRTIDPVKIRSSNSYDHLRRVNFANTPHVNILRVHAQADHVGLGDVPTGFSSGCNPNSTKYCRRQLHMEKGEVLVSSPIVTAAPVVQPIMGAAVVGQPAVKHSAPSQTANFSAPMTQPVMPPAATLSGNTAVTHSSFEKPMIAKPYSGAAPSAPAPAPAPAPAMTQQQISDTIMQAIAPMLQQVEHIDDVAYTDPMHMAEIKAPPANQIHDGGDWVNISGAPQVKGSGFISGMTCQPAGVPVAVGAPILPPCGVSGGLVPQLAGAPRYGRFGSR